MDVGKGDKWLCSIEYVLLFKRSAPLRVLKAACLLGKASLLNLSIVSIGSVGKMV